MPDGAYAFQAIQSNFRKQSLLVHPDPVRRVDGNAGPRYMQVLSRPIEQAEFEARYAVLTGHEEDLNDAVIPWGLYFSLFTSEEEGYVNEFELR